MSSDVEESNGTSSVYRCSHCTETSSGVKTSHAKWYCYSCDKLLCRECKTQHDIFTLNENHAAASLHRPCGPCKRRDSSLITATWYCHKCAEFLCRGCRSLHKALGFFKSHTYISSFEKITDKKEDQFFNQVEETSRGGIESDISTQPIVLHETIAREGEKKLEQSVIFSSDCLTNETLDGASSCKVSQGVSVDQSFQLNTQSGVQVNTASETLVVDKDGVCCSPCASSFGTSTQAVWYCRQCSDLLCQKCKVRHDTFRFTDDHLVPSLLSPCDPCQKKDSRNVRTSKWYCCKCDGFLCDDCLVSHNIFTEQHNICSSIAWIVGQRVMPLFQCKAQYVTKVNVANSSDRDTPLIVGLVSLPDSNILGVDAKNMKVKIFNEEFQFLKEASVTEKPRKMAHENGRLAFTTYGRKIILFCLSSGNLGRMTEIALDIDCCGVAFVSDEELAVTSINPGGFYVFKKTGTTVASLVEDSDGKYMFCQPFDLATDISKSRVYISDREFHNITAIDLKTKIPLFTYKHIGLRAPAGLTVDSEGNIYVCGLKSNNIHQISEDGQDGKIILSKGSGMNRPYMVLYISKGDKLLVGNSNLADGRYVKVFKMSQNTQGDSQGDSQCAIN